MLGAYVWSLASLKYRILLDSGLPTLARFETLSVVSYWLSLHHDCDCQNHDMLFTVQNLHIYIL